MMSQDEEIRLLKESQSRLELEIIRLRSLVEPSANTVWWNSLDVQWKILFMQHVRGERLWADTWRWASDWDVVDYKPTPKFWEKIGNIQIFGCALQRHHPKITSLEPLARVQNLVGLNCGQTEVDDLEPIAHLTSMRYLDIYNTHIDDLRPIANWKDLESLNYQHHFSQRKDDLSHFPKLKYLNIRYGHLDDLSYLSSLTELESLNIAYTFASSLKPIYGHKNLKKIYLRNTPIPAHEIAEFQELHPNCDMGYEPGEPAH